MESRAITTKLSGHERLAYIRDQVLIEVGGGDILVVLEGYAFSRVNLTHLGEVVGVVKVALWEAGIPSLVQLTPGGLKKFVSGRGNAKKDEMRLEAFKRFGFEAKTQDEVEAVCLAWAGRYWLAKAEGDPFIPVSHVAALEKMEVLW
jgi:crossover junction endodeoxyribonuclease RuvC